MAMEKENIKDKRIFLVCRSKNCQLAKRAKTRCTISMPKLPSGNEAYLLNKRILCLVFVTPTILETKTTPHWVVSPDKPGERKKREKAKSDEQDFYIKNPDFLEIA